MDTKKFYQKWARHWDAYYEGHTKPSLLIRMAYARAHALETGAKRVLDLGCGTGHFVKFLNEKGVLCDGMDLSAKMLKIAERNLSSGYKGELVRGNFERRDHFPRHRYDLATAFGIFVHQINESKVFANVRNILRPGGYFIASFRNDLFSTFAMNRETVRFFEEITRASPLTPEDRGLYRDFLKGSAKNKYVPSNPSAHFEKVFNRFHNPLTIGRLFAENGFIMEDIHFLNIHPVPPALLGQIKNADHKALYLEEHYHHRWQGMFLASSFLVNARKATEQEWKQLRKHSDRDFYLPFLFEAGPLKRQGFLTRAKES